MFVACDESGINPSDKYLIIGSAWISKQGLCEFEKDVTALRLKHKCWGEVKWSKVGTMSDEMFQFYKDFIALAFQDIEISFRTIVVEKKLLDMTTYHNGSEELVRFKFSHLLLSRHGERFLDKAGKKALHIVFDDFQLTQQAKDEKWVLKMKAHIEHHLGEHIEHLQSATSHICSLIQLCDLFVGAISSSWNNSPSKISQRKKELIEYIEQKIGKKVGARTLPTEKDFNVWVWQPSPRIVLTRR
jgi:hypothetical protein